MKTFLHLYILTALALAPTAVPAQTGADHDSIVYLLAPPPASRLDVRTGKAGLLGFAGHEHRIRARTFTGRVVLYPDQPALSHVAITIAAESLAVLTPPDTAEIRKVTAAMRNDVLDVGHYAEITFISRTVERSGDTLHLVGALTMKGKTQDVAPVVRISLVGDTLRASTVFTVKQTDFGIRPYRGGPGGTVRVADTVTFDIDAVALRRR